MFVFLTGREAQTSSILIPLPCELVAAEALLDKRGQLGLLVDLPQHLVHHAEQGTAHAQQFIQGHIVTRVAPDVRPHSCERLAHICQQPSRRHTHSLAGTLRPTQASPKQGNQGTWGLHLDAAHHRVAPVVHWRMCNIALVFLRESMYTGGAEWNTHHWDTGSIVNALTNPKGIYLYCHHIKSII